MQAMTIELLPGDWWLRRKVRVPDPEKLGNSTQLQDFSKKAAKLADRGISNFYIGVEEWLKELDLYQDGMTDQKKEMAKRLEYKGSEWQRRINMGEGHWTEDLTYKVALLRGMPEPSPQVLDWAAMLTWITIEQGRMSSGTLPSDILIYAACAMHKCNRINSVNRECQTNADVEAGATRLIEDYLNCKRPILLRESDRNYLRSDLEKIPNYVLVTAGKVSEQLRAKFQEWGWNND